MKSFFNKIDIINIRLVLKYNDYNLNEFLNLELNEVRSIYKIYLIIKRYKHEIPRNISSFKFIIKKFLPEDYFIDLIKFYGKNCNKSEFDTIPLPNCVKYILRISYDDLYVFISLKSRENTWV